MFPINESSIDSYLIIINFLSNEQKKKTCLSGTGCHRSIKKKTTRDVIADGVRWTEAMRVVRADHPEVTIIMPGEKIQVHPGDDVRRLITPYVAVIRQALDCKRGGEWKGYTTDCRVRQVRRLLTHYFYFHEGCISEADFNLMVEDLLFVHKAG